MSFGIANNVKSEVRECTLDLLSKALDSAQVAKICAEIEDALEKCRRGEITKEEYEKYIKCHQNYTCFCHIGMYNDCM